MLLGVDMAAAITPHTKHPDTYYWIRVLTPESHGADLWTFEQEHIYLSKRLVREADDKTLTALLAHGMAHVELGHRQKRNIVQTI